MMFSRFVNIAGVGVVGLSVLDLSIYDTPEMRTVVDFLDSNPPSVVRALKIRVENNRKTLADHELRECPPVFTELTCNVKGLTLKLNESDDGHPKLFIIKNPVLSAMDFGFLSGHEGVTCTRASVTFHKVHVAPYEIKCTVSGGQQAGLTLEGLQKWQIDRLQELRFATDAIEEIARMSKEARRRFAEYMRTQAANGSQPNIDWILLLGSYP